MLLCVGTLTFIVVVCVSVGRLRCLGLVCSYGFCYVCLCIGWLLIGVADCFFQFVVCCVALLVLFVAEFVACVGWFADLLG